MQEMGFVIWSLLLDLHSVAGLSLLHGGSQIFICYRFVSGSTACVSCDLGLHVSGNMAWNDKASEDALILK